MTARTKQRAGERSDKAMRFELTEEQRLVQETAREFAENDIKPTLQEEERNHEFRTDRVARMGELGFFSCAVYRA